MGRRSRKLKNAAQLSLENAMNHQIISSTQTVTPVDPLAELRATAQASVNFLVLSPYASCLVEPHQVPEALAANYKELYIIANGEYYKHVELIGGRHVRVKIPGIPAKFKDLIKNVRMTTVREEINFLPAGKIPYSYWEQLVQFFRQVMKLKKQDYEAHAWILWEPDKGYYISVPKQTVSKASVSFTYDPETLPPGAIIVVDVHSH